MDAFLSLKKKLDSSLKNQYQELSKIIMSRFIFSNELESFTDKPEILLSEISESTEKKFKFFRWATGKPFKI